MKYYKIYHQFIRRFITLCILGTSGFGIGAVVYFLTDSPEACIISALAIFLLTLVLFYKWVLTWPCPCCRHRPAYLLFEQVLHPMVHGYRRYYVLCKKCGTKMNTDLVAKQRFFWQWFYELTEEEILDDTKLKDRKVFTKADLFIYIFGTAFVIALFYFFHSYYMCG